MSNLVERLEHEGGPHRTRPGRFPACFSPGDPLCAEAAAEIRRLTIINEALRAALDSALPIVQFYAAALVRGEGEKK